MKTIDERFQEALKNVGKESIDFWGINVTDKAEVSCKIYRSEKVEHEKKHPFFQFLCDRNMLRHYEQVIDSSKDGQVRLDAALYQRNDVNMKELFERLQNMADFLEPHISDIKKLSRMKITDVSDYNYASLYHVGLLESAGKVELLKFYFFTRWCENPNHHGKDGYRDFEYLNYLKSVNIPEYESLLQEAKYILDKCGGHLWMIGVDVSPVKMKYKIYLKNIHDTYEYLPEILGQKTRHHINKISAWNQIHQECRVAGIALAVDTEGVKSVNIYYHVD